jgi:molybdopterin molybdotransferase
MVEYTSREGNDVVIEQSLPPGRNFVAQGSESVARTIVLRAGSRLEYLQVALLASVGKSTVPVFRQPRVAILSTGDEVVEVDETPESYQIRNSNAYSLAAQVWRRGGIPEILPIAPDRLDETRNLVEIGLESDMLLLSGGVSMGKYDLVEDVFADLGAELFFTQVLIQPGKPLVFGNAAGKPFFGLPGNPISTMVTFEVFASLALARLAGAANASLPFTEAVLAEDFRHHPSLTRFLPARLEGEYGEARVSPVKWQGSGDLASIAQANCFLVAAADRESWDAGERIAVLPL